MVDGLDLLHLDEPRAQVLGGRGQHTVAVIRGLVQHLCVGGKGCEVVLRRGGG